MAVQYRDNGSIVITTRITLKPGRDDKIIDLLLDADNVAGTIREAMRTGIKGTFAISENVTNDIDFDIGLEL